MTIERRASPSGLFITSRADAGRPSLQASETTTETLTKRTTEPTTYEADDSDLPRLCDLLSRLADIGYSEGGITERLGIEDLGELRWQALSIHRTERLCARDPLALAIDLFLFQGALPPNELASLCAPGEIEILVRAGLVAIDDAGWARARTSLYPVGFPSGDRLIFSDHAWPALPHPGYTKVPSDHVMAIGRDSRNLARCTSRRSFRSALDLCTGSGIHALLASAHSERTLAVDINPRAAQSTRFNARCSRAANLEVAVGDLFDAPGVRGETFDLITANPPFVPSPRDEVKYRDGGRSGEDVQKRIVAGLPGHLAPGGIAQIVTELGERPDEPLTIRVREWLGGAPMDIHILRLGEHTATNYAIGHANGSTSQDAVASIDKWAENLRAQGYARIVSLIISFQWSDSRCGSPWERVDESPPPQRAAGCEIEATFAAERLARRSDSQTLKRSRLRRSGPTAIFDAQVLGGEMPSTAKAVLLGRALVIEHQLDAVQRRILDQMNGDFEGRVSVEHLVAMSHYLGTDESSIIAATRSLLRCQLIQLDGVAKRQLNSSFKSSGGEL